MERLIHANVISSKRHCNLKPSSYPLVPRFGGVASARNMAFVSASFHRVPLRVNSISSGLRDPYLVSPETREKLPLSEDSAGGPAPKPHTRTLIPPQRK
ncbi:auxilin-related protein 1-like [Dorcoceras hygrometricum]|uniref:Auxilin-related protein 1-like n=1 Tax=Dorcoceras hygrometricum TaxID=472368 RepID=A0A2Z7AMA6_9LAMI|nr:auxilin-related protein 1-like [Dorcoceras hygrometricum]